MKIMELTLKGFKKALKPRLRENDVEFYKILTSRKAFSYQAEIVDGRLVVTVPGKKRVDGRFVQISPLSLRRRKHTVNVFIEKRLSILSTV